LTNSTAKLLVSIYTQGADRSELMMSRLDNLNSPAILIEALGLTGYPIEIAEVKAPVAEGLAEGQQTSGSAPVEAVLPIVSAIVLLGVVAAAVVYRKVRARRHHNKKDYGLSIMDSVLPDPRRLRIDSWVPHIDDTAPILEGVSPRRRNSDPGALSPGMRESDGVQPARRLRRRNSDPLARSFIPLTGYNGMEVQPHGRLNSLIAGGQARQARARLANWKAEAEARRVTATAEQRAKSLIGEAERRLAAVEGAMEARAKAVVEAECAKEEAQRVKEEAQRIKEEAIAKAQEQGKQLVKQAEVKAQLMQGMQNVMQQIMSEESRILHEDEMEARQYAREQTELQRQLEEEERQWTLQFSRQKMEREEEEARAHLQTITEEANEASLRLQEALHFEEESKAALERMDIEKRRLKTLLQNLQPRKEQKRGAIADSEGHASSAAAFVLDVDSHPQSSPVSVQECNLSGMPNDRWKAHTDAAHINAGNPPRPTVSPSGELPAPAVKHRINRFERLMKPDLESNGNVSSTGGCRPTANECRRPMYLAQRAHLAKAQRPTELELTTTGYETSSTSKDSSPRSAESSPRSAEPRLGQGQVILAPGVASPESRTTIYI